MEKDMYGRGPQTAEAKELDIFVEQYEIVNGNPGKMIASGWVKFKTHCIDIDDIDEEYNVVNMNDKVVYNVMVVK